MALGEQHVLGYSSDGKLFALINDQGVLRIWDTETNALKQEYTPNLHLSGPVTALLWIVATTESQKAKKLRSSKDGSTETPYIALGTSTGKLSLYSYAAGKIERVLKGNGHDGKVTAITRDEAGHLYTCGEDCKIIKWSLQEEQEVAEWSIGTDKPYGMIYAPHSGNLIVGTRQVKVFATSSQELLQTFIGHSSYVNLVTSFVTPDGVEYALTASRMERIICMWKIGKKAQQNQKSATCSLIMEDIARCLSCHLNEEGILLVTSVTRSGVIHVYRVALDSIKSTKPIKPKVTISIASEGETTIAPIQAVSASLNYSDNDEKILFSYGDKHFMIFERIMPNFADKMQVLVRTNPKKLFAIKTGQQSATAEGTAAVSMLTLTPIVNTETVDYHSAVAVSRKKLKPTEIPMEARLQNLNLNLPDGTVTPLAQSKVQLLVQALHSKDKLLLRQVLSTNDRKTISLTLQKLPVQYVDALVTELTQMMEQKSMNVAYSLNWLKTLVHTHSSQLMALGADDLFNKFGPCIGIIEHRANCLKEVSKLNGRLQLLVTQIKRNVSDTELNNENVLVYEDNDSSGSDHEGVFSGSVSGEEWEEDDEDDDDEIAEDSHDEKMDEDEQHNNIIKHSDDEEIEDDDEIASDFDMNI